jgi:hypothetical protein
MARRCQGGLRRRILPAFVRRAILEKEDRRDMEQWLLRRENLFPALLPTTSISPKHPISPCKTLSGTLTGGSQRWIFRLRRLDFLILILL